VSSAARAVYRWLVAGALLFATSAAVSVSAEPETELAPEAGEQSESEADDHAERGPAAACAPLLVDRQVAEKALREVLSRRELRFCEDTSYRLRDRDRALCELSEPASGRCPAFRNLCARAGAPRAPSSDPHKPESRSELEVPGAMSSAARVVFWLLIAVVAIGLIAAILKNAIGDRPAKAASTEPESDERRPHAALPRGPVETSVERLLSRARAAARRGEYASAMADCHAALLRQLEHMGVLELQSACTNGDYVRALGGHPELQRQLLSAVRELEPVQFGAASASSGAFERLLRSVMSLVGRAGPAALLALFATLGTSSAAFAAGSAEGVWGRGPSGLSLVHELLAVREIESGQRVRPLSDLEEDAEPDALVVLDGQHDEKDWDALLSFAARGGILIVADPQPVSRRLGATAMTGVCDGKLTIESALIDLGPGHVGVRVPAHDVLRLVNDEGPAFETLASCGEEAYVARKPLGVGSVVVLPSADLFTNVSMLSADNASFVSALLADVDEVEFVGAWTGAGASTPFEAVANTRLTPALVQLFLLLAVLYVWKGAHFGRPRDPPPRSRRAFVEHVRALGLTYARAQAARHVLASYGEFALDKLRERMRPGSDTSLHGLSRAIAERTGRPEGAVMSALVEARTAREDAGRSGRAQEDLETMREIERLLIETGGAR